MRERICSRLLTAVWIVCGCLALMPVADAELTESWQVWQAASGRSGVPGRRVGGGTR